MRIISSRISDGCVVSLQITGFSLTHHSKCSFNIVYFYAKSLNTALYSVEINLIFHSIVRNKFSNSLIIFKTNFHEELRQGRSFFSISLLKFGYSEKATKFCEISNLLLSVCTVDKSMVEISQNFVAFSEYTNFIKWYINCGVTFCCKLLLFQLPVTVKESFYFLLTSEPNPIIWLFQWMLKKV